MELDYKIDFLVRSLMKVQIRRTHVHVHKFIIAFLWLTLLVDGFHRSEIWWVGMHVCVCRVCVCVGGFFHHRNK
jgi:hypothetical protein